MACSQRACKVAAEQHLSDTDYLAVLAYMAIERVEIDAGLRRAGERSGAYTRSRVPESIGEDVA